jgi:hypothetical protein
LNVSSRRLHVALAVCAVVGLAAAPAHARPRSIGLGWNAAAGLLAGDSEVHFAWEAASPELRLFVADGVSLDLQWDVIGMIRARAELGRGVYLQRTYLHLYAQPQARATFAVAPYLLTGIGAADGATYGTLGTGARVGAEVFSPSGGFGLGLYARPGLVLAGVTGVRPAAGFVLLAEVTWTFYPPPRPRRGGPSD